LTSGDSDRVLLVGPIAPATKRGGRRGGELVATCRAIGAFDVDVAHQMLGAIIAWLIVGEKVLVSACRARSKIGAVDASGTPAVSARMSLLPFWSWPAQRARNPRPLPRFWISVPKARRYQDRSRFASSCSRGLT
jgi:hypothetical protein